MTPLKQARLNRKWKLRDVCHHIKAHGKRLDTGNLSRIETGKQPASPEMAACLAAIFIDDGLTEMQIIYPERYMSKDV